MNKRALHLKKNLLLASVAILIAGIVLTVTVPAPAYQPKASQIQVDTANFDNNLSPTEDTVQKALEVLDDLIAAGGGLANIVEDATPQLGGDLDGQSTYDLANIVNAEFEGYVEIGSDPADAGSIRLPNASVIAWEDATELTLTHVDNTGLSLNGNFTATTFTGNVTGTASGNLVSTDIDTYSELNTIVADQTLVYAGGAFHDGFSDFVANEHIDWTSDQGATDIHSGNIPDLSGTYQPLDVILTSLSGLADPGGDRLVAWDEDPTNGYVHIDYSGWDTNAGDDFNGAYSSLSGIPSTFAPSSHASSHAVSGSDTVFPADPNADRYLMWDDDPGVLAWATAAGSEINNLETITTGIAVNEIPTGTADNTVVYKAVPDCNVEGSALNYEDSTQTWSCRSGFAAGGGLANIVEDTTPQLGGDLDGQSTYDLANIVNAEFEGYVEIGSDPADAGSIRLPNTSVIAWEDATELTLTHVDNTGLSLNGNFTAATFIGALTGTASGNLTAETNSLETLTTGIAVDEVPVGTDTNTVVYKVIADCDGNGSALNYDTTGHNFSCKTLADADMPDSAAVSSWNITTPTFTTTALLAGILQDNDDMVFEVDANSDGSNKYSFTDGAATEVMSLTEAGNLQIDGTLDVDSTSDFGTSTVAGSMVIHDAGTITLDDDGDNTSVVIGPVANGTTTLGITGTVNATALQEGGNAVYNSGETPGGELGGTWDSPTIDDSITVTGWALGNSTATTLNKLTLTQPANGSTLTLIDGKTLTVTNTVDIDLMTDEYVCNYEATGTKINCDIAIDATTACAAGSICGGGHTHGATEITEADPNALLTAGTDNVKDTHIDWGTGAGQVSPADFVNQDIGDITITTGSWAVEDDSHNHVIGNIDSFTSAALYGQISDETGSGSGSPLAVFSINPTLTGATLATTTAFNFGSNRIDNGSDQVDDDMVAFDDADSNWTAATIGAVLEELDDANGGAPNQATGKVNWEQLVSVPAGFADGTDDGGAGATAYDDIADPDAASSISFGDTETVTYDTAQATAGGFFILSNSVADLAADVSLLDLKFTDDGDANGFFLRGYDNSGADLKWSIGADGAASFASVETSPIATPSVDFYDSDATAGDINAQISANATDVGNGTEDVDILIKQQIAGSLDTVATFDADGVITFAKTLALGANDLTMTGSLAATGSRVTKGWFADIESTNMPTVGGTAILTSLTAPQFTTIELGHATDTTLARADSGRVTIEGAEVPTVAGRSLTAMTNTFAADAELYTDTIMAINIEDPTAADVNFGHPGIELASTVTKVVCSTDTGTATINIEERAAATPNTAGTDILSADIVCDNNTQSACASGCDVNTISNASLDAGDPIIPTVTSVASSPTLLRVAVIGTGDD